jgi:hypothetical protein
LGNAIGESGARERSDDCCGGKSGEKGPVEVHRAEIAGKSGGGIHGDHRERRTDRLPHGDASQDHERGDDEKAAADSDEAGQHSDAEGGRHEQGWAWGCTGPGVGPTAEHRSRRGGHDDGEQRELGAPAQEHRQLRARECADHRENAEGKGHSDAHVPESPVKRGADHARDAHHGQAHRDRWLRGVPEHVDEHGYRQDRSATAEESQRESYRGCEREADGEHESALRPRTSCRLRALIASRSVPSRT